MHALIVLRVTAIVLAFVFACGGGGSGGGGSGVDRSKAVTDLSPDELTELCEYLVGLQEQPERMIDCGGGETLTVGINPAEVPGAVSECANEPPPDACPLTVGEAEDCFEAIEALSDEALCGDEVQLPRACSFFNDPNCEG